MPRCFPAFTLFATATPNGPRPIVSRAAPICRSTPWANATPVALATRLQGLNFSRVFTSPLQRARRTCELAGFAAAAQIDPDLAEWNYGDIEGHFSPDVYRDRPGWDLFRDGAPHGESPQDVASRADRFITKVRQTPGDAIAFSSGHISRMIAVRWLASPPTAAGRFLCSTASIGILSYEHTLDRPAIELWNDDGIIPR